MIPRNLRSLFWDISLEAFDPASFPDYTIFRILEYGDKEAVEWLKETFAVEEIRRVISSERRLSPRAATFWALVYEIPSRQVAALKATR